MAASRSLERVAIVYPRATFDSVPTLCGAVEVLARRGYLVEVFACRNPGEHPPRFDTPGVRFHSLGPEELTPVRVPTGLTWAAGGRNQNLRRLLRPARRAYTSVLGVLKSALSFAAAGRTRAYLRRSHRQAPYRLFLGVDPDGLVLAARFARLVGAPIAYQSLELLLSAEITDPAQRQLKEREIALTRACELVVVQDEARARLLARDNGLSTEQLVLVPNAPLGPARRRRTQYWHQRFGLAPEQRVVLHAGSLGPWTGIEEIVRGVAAWPAEWVLVVHTRYNAESSEYVDRLRATADPRRVLFSLRPVDRHEYDNLVDGADIGIAFYVPTGESSFDQQNVETIGLSSGKIAYYARSGIPTLANAASSVGDLVEDAGCGVKVQAAIDIAAALADASGRYEDLSAGACRFFDTHLDFERSFAAAVDRLRTAPVPSPEPSYSS